MSDGISHEYVQPKKGQVWLNHNFSLTSTKVLLLPKSNHRWNCDGCALCIPSIHPNYLVFSGAVSECSTEFIHHFILFFFSTEIDWFLSHAECHKKNENLFLCTWISRYNSVTISQTAVRVGCFFFPV